MSDRIVVTDVLPAAPAPEPEASPPRWVPAPRWAVIGIFLMLAFQATAIARSFLMPVILALLLALVFSPMRRFLERWGVPAGFGAALIVGSLLIATVLGGFGLSGPAADWVDNAPVIRSELQLKLRDLRDAAAGVREAAQEVDKIAGGGEPAAGQDEVQRVVIEDSGYLGTIALSMPSIIAQVTFTLILLFFLLASGDMFYEKIVHAMPTFGDKKRAIRIVYDIERKLSRYLFTITVINAGLGLAIGVTMWSLGMPNPVLLGVLGFGLNYIPFLGAAGGVLIAAVVALISLPTFNDALVVAIAYFLLTSIEGQFITPYFVGRSLQLNTVVVFVAVALWAWLWSVVGMLVATPLLVMVRTLCEHVETLQPFGDFLSARGAERPPDPEEEA